MPYIELSYKMTKISLCLGNICKKNINLPAKGLRMNIYAICYKLWIYILYNINYEYIYYIYITQRKWCVFRVLSTDELEYIQHTNKYTNINMYTHFRSRLIIMVFIFGNGICNLSSNLDKAICVSLHANDLGKSICQSILPSTMGR